ncbi:MAG: hypothetical protein LBH76_02235, partial [Propionibacteriaceae bacterium]|nr:hypothetical protein [Propionibacteriaceae bacterium]
WVIAGFLSRVGVGDGGLPWLGQLSRGGLAQSLAQTPESAPIFRDTLAQSSFSGRFQPCEFLKGRSHVAFA